MTRFRDPRSRVFFEKNRGQLSEPATRAQEGSRRNTTIAVPLLPLTRASLRGPERMGGADQK